MPTTVQQARRGAKRIFRWCLVRGRLDETRVRAAAQKILEPPRRGHLAVLTHFFRLVKLEQARYAALIESVGALPSDLRTRVQKELEIIRGSRITAVFARNDALIGGMRIQIGNDVYDGSVLSRLEMLERSFGITAEWKKARAD